MPSVTEIQLNKPRALFPANDLSLDLGKSRPAQCMGGGDYIIAAYQAGKCARSLLGLNQVGYRTLQCWHGASARHQDVFMV